MAYDILLERVTRNDSVYYTKIGFHGKDQSDLIQIYTEERQLSSLEIGWADIDWSTRKFYWKPRPEKAKHLRKLVWAKRSLVVRAFFKAIWNWE